VTSMLDAPPSKRGAAPVLAVAGTLAAHGALVVLASFAGVRAVSELQRSFPITELVQVELPAPSPPPPAPVTPPTEPAVAPRARAPKSAPAPAAAPPAAAQAGQVLEAKSDFVDFGDRIVTGAGERFAGGTTDSAGTSRAAVRSDAARGASTGLGSGPAAPAVDLSRPPQLAGAAQWQCPFPPEADDAGVDHAVVSLRVQVAADGSVRNVSTTNDPGDGFGREARRCAASKRWVPALDGAGMAAAGVAFVKVHFDR
jgi:periplasmic protein TonB